MNNILDIDKIIDNKLGLEAYLILYCLYTKNKQLIQTYTNQCKKINTEIFNELIEANYISMNNSKDNKIYYELLSLTEQGALIAKKCLSPYVVKPNSLISEHNFEDFKHYYPSSVKEGVKSRKLHGDLRRCRISYDKLLLETTHDVLCKCAKLYHNEMIRSNSEYYMQNLVTWLNQANYKQYLEEANKIDNKDNNTIEHTNIDAI